MLCYFCNSLQAKPMRFLVGRHPVETVAIESVFAKTLVDEIYDGYFVEFVAIVLRQNSIAYRGHQLGFFGRKEANRWNLLYPGENYISRRLVPKISLAKGSKARVVAGLCAQWQRLARFWIDGPPSCSRQDISVPSETGLQVILEIRTLRKGVEQRWADHT